MQHLVWRLAAICVALVFVLTACSQPGAPEPTKPAAAQPTAAPATAQPTAAAAPAEATTPPAPAAPTAAASTVAYPEKGKAIQMIVPWAAGGSTDVAARLIAPIMESELGTPVQVVVKPGAASQVGLTELVAADPDGYTLANTVWPSTSIVYLDPDRQATFGREDLQSVAAYAVAPMLVGVKADSPYGDITDLVEAAKANPNSVKIGDTGVLTVTNLTNLALAQASGAELAIVHFDGDAPGRTALLGGHIDAFTGNASSFISQIKSGDIRALAVTGNQESKFFPGVKTMKEQGYNVYFEVITGLVAPAGTPKEIVDKLAAVVEKATASEEFIQKAENLGMEVRYFDTAQMDTAWTELENQVKPLIEQAKAEAQKTN